MILADFFAPLVESVIRKYMYFFYPVNYELKFSKGKFLKLSECLLLLTNSLDRLHAETNVVAVQLKWKNVTDSV